MAKTPKDGRHRNVPNRLGEINDRIANLEQSLAENVEAVALDVVPELVRDELRRMMRTWCDELEPK